MKIIDGKMIAAQFRTELRQKISQLDNAPGLAVVIVGEDHQSVGQSIHGIRKLDRGLMMGIGANFLGDAGNLKPLIHIFGKEAVRVFLELGAEILYKERLFLLQNGQRGGFN